MQKHFHCVAGGLSVREDTICETSMRQGLWRRARLVERPHRQKEGAQPLPWKEAQGPGHHCCTRIRLHLTGGHWATTGCSCRGAGAC